MSLRISAIIPAVNEAATIERAISSSFEAGLDEVLVVDGGSQDTTQEIAESCGAQVVQSSRGRAIQQNTGADRTSGEVLLFLHADNWLSPGAGQQIRSCLQNGAQFGGAFEQSIDAPQLVYRWLERGNAARVRRRGLAYGDQAIFMRRVVFQQIGRFPEVDLMEDVLLMRAFRKMAHPVLLPGPVHVSPRRWQQQGVVRQTLRNWAMLVAFSVGMSPRRLARFYQSHDSPCG